MSYTTDSNKLISKAYSRLSVLNNISWTPYRDKCYEMACAEERQHRRGKPADVRIAAGASIQATGRFFVVLRIAQYLLGERMPDIKDLLAYQPSAMYAAALVAAYSAEIREALKDVELRELVALDYCEFVGSK